MSCVRTIQQQNYEFDIINTPETIFTSYLRSWIHLDLCLHAEHGSYQVNFLKGRCWTSAFHDAFDMEKSRMMNKHKRYLKQTQGKNISSSASFLALFKILKTACSPFPWLWELLVIFRAVGIVNAFEKQSHAFVCCWEVLLLIQKVYSNI